MTAAEMPKAFEPRDVEPRWYAFWLEHRVFEAGRVDASRPTYVLPMPPPNVTGSLHMGHALTTAIEDVLTRWHRMRGFDTLWQPGLDHAGIATQTVVERQLKREGKTRHDLGREAFVQRIWQWKAESGGRIHLQQRELGASPDWSRAKFTMDPELSVAVTEAFVRLHEEGLIYRATRLINWCVDCRTALSDLEVENEEGAQGELFEFAYRVDGSDDELVVATTRPETMLGDTAVAVHPEDPRYLHLHGKRLVHPFVERTIPIVTDAILVDPKFGTGAVKVTPAHDFNDFATGKRHGLAEISIFTLDGKVNENGGAFAGLDRKESRKAVKKRLEELGLVRGGKPHALNLPKCQRCGTVVEPMISTQWFVQMKPLAEPALAAVESGRTKIVPEEWKKTYDHFLSNIQDWCISRQLWWGHQIPAWFCESGHATVAREAPKACATCASTTLRQDEDVLDTWFSSALWPLSTLGWPAKTPELARYYPASDLETGYDILFFWVARMMMMGLHFMGDVPFRRVLLHGLVVDENGEKMSKVKGNVIDPLDLVHGSTFDDVVQKAMPGAPLGEALAKFKKSYPSVAQMGSGFPAFGADALRFTLASYSPQAKRIALAPKRIEGYRHFCNKIWNAVRFAMPYVETAKLPADGAAPPATWRASRWILARLARAVDAANEGLGEFRLDDATSALYAFFWNELCDWYLELMKPVVQGGDERAKAEVGAVLAHVLETSLRALHPFVPFITEDLWQRLPRPASRPVSIAIAPWPTAADGRADAEAEREMAIVQAAIGAIRTIRSEFEIHPAKRVDAAIISTQVDRTELFRSERTALSTLAKTTPPAVETGEGFLSRVGKWIRRAVDGDTVVFVRSGQNVDWAREKARAEKRLQTEENELRSLRQRRGNPGFVAKAAPEVLQATDAEIELKTRRRERFAEDVEYARQRIELQASLPVPSGAEIWRSYPESAPADATLLDAAKALARAHYESDPATIAIYFAPDASQKEIRLVEVSLETETTNEILTFEFAPHPEQGIYRRSCVILVSPTEWDALRNGQLTLPSGWAVDVAGLLPL